MQENRTMHFHYLIVVVVKNVMMKRLFLLAYSQLEEISNYMKSNNHNLNKYVDKMRSLSTNTVESILEIGNVIVEAKVELSKTEYAEFLKLTKYDSKSASIRKWERIGHAYVRLKPIAHILPPNWSTIYKIAKLKADELDLLQKLNILHSNVTAKEIDNELKTPSKKSSLLRITIQLDNDIDMKSVKQLLNVLTKECSQYSCTLKKSAELEELLNSTAISNSSLKLAA